MLQRLSRKKSSGNKSSPITAFKPTCSQYRRGNKLSKISATNKRLGRYKGGTRPVKFSSAKFRNRQSFFGSTEGQIREALTVISDLQSGRLLFCGFEIYGRNPGLHR